MSNKEWFSPVGNTCSSVQTGYEGCRAQVAQTVKGWCGPEAGKGKLIEKVSKSVSEILIDLSALTGILVLPASLFFAAKRVVPLLSLLKEYFRKGSTKESVSIQWKEIKAGYRKTFEENMAPALMVALGVDAVFCIVVGVLSLNLFCLLRGVALSGSASYFMYRKLMEQSQREPEVQAPTTPQQPPQVQQALDLPSAPLPPPVAPGVPTPAAPPLYGDLPK